MTDPQATTPHEAVDLGEDQDAVTDPIVEIHARADRAEDQWRRAAADLDNLQKRFQREVTRERAAERERVTLQWVAMIDDLDRALAHTDPETTAGLGEGVEVITNNAIAAIAALGYLRFGTAGDVFDAALHEVVTTVPADDENPSNTIAAVIKAGYGTRENLLRPASVVVATEAD